MTFHSPAVFMQTAEMTLGEKGISSAKVILTGFVVVFAVLLLLIAIIKIYSAIVEKAQSATDRRKLKKKEPIPETKAEFTPKKKEYISKETVPASNGEIPEEVIAVIAAAVDSVYGSSGKARIKSIKKSGAGRSAWANAGVLENTRPF